MNKENFSCIRLIINHFCLIGSNIWYSLTFTRCFSMHNLNYRDMKNAVWKHENILGRTPTSYKLWPELCSCVLLMQKWNVLVPKNFDCAVVTKSNIIKMTVKFTKNKAVYQRVVSLRFDSIIIDRQLKRIVGDRERLIQKVNENGDIGGINFLTYNLLTFFKRKK